MKKLIVLGLLLIAAVMLTACGGGDPDVSTILSDSADTMSSVDSLTFTIIREGDPVLLNAELNASMLGADGVYQSPGQVYATVDVLAGTFTATAEVIWNDSGAYFKLPPLLPTFEPIDLVGTFDATAIFNAEVGLPSVLANLASPELIGQEDIDGVNTYHVRGTADGARLEALFGGAVIDGSATMDVWIDTATNEIVRATITESGGGSWTLDLYDYGQPVEIPSP